MVGFKVVCMKAKGIYIETKKLTTSQNKYCVRKCEPKHVGVFICFGPLAYAHTSLMMMSTISSYLILYVDFCLCLYMCSSLLQQPQLT